MHQYEFKWELISEQPCLLGEGPVWDERQQSLYWVDILKGKIHFARADGKSGTLEAGDQVGAIAFTETGGIIAAMRKGFARWNAEAGKMERILGVEEDIPGNRFNDGKCDPAGRFFAGTMTEGPDRGLAALYVLDRDYSVRKCLDGVSCSNGLAWSEDGRTMYYIDTMTRRLDAFDYDPGNGRMQNRRTLTQFGEEEGYPDGMTIDREGKLWIALWGGSRVVRCDPADGRRLTEIRLPVTQPSSCTFGGADFRDLYISSAAVGLSEAELARQPLAGCLFVVRQTPYQGWPAHRFNDRDFRPAFLQLKA